MLFFYSNFIVRLRSSRTSTARRYLRRIDLGLFIIKIITTLGKAGLDRRVHSIDQTSIGLKCCEPQIDRGVTFGLH